MREYWNPLKIKTIPPPTHRRQLQNLVKTIGVGVRNTCPNTQKTLLNCFRDHKYILCCENTVYKRDFCDNFTIQTVKFPDLSRFWLAMLGFGLPSWKDPRQQSTKVEKSKIQCFSFTKLQKLLKSVQ